LKGDTTVEQKDEKVKQKITTLKREIQNISTNLKELGGQKEEQYEQKNTLDKQLNALINKAKELKDSKHEIDTQISKFKKEREDKNKQYNQFLSTIKQAKEDRRRQQRSVSSNSLRKQIKDLEYNMQTEALNFNKEKKIMGEIKKIKTQLKEILIEEEKLKSNSVSFKEVKEIKLLADDAHKKVQELAGKSSKIFDELTILSKDIANIKAQRNTVQLVLKNLKSQIGHMNQKLSKILKDWSGIADKVFIRGTKRSIDKLLHKKTEEVKEKLKSKKKLTTDDILLLQREAMGR
jgi:uncharacterized coiled-coil DUF342 family protein